MNNKALDSGIQALDKGREKLGQVQILAIMLFLLLIPTTAIIAQNSTINITGDVIADVPTEEVTLPEPLQDSNQTNTTESRSPREPVEPTEPEPVNITEPENNETNNTNTTEVAPPRIPSIPSNYTNQTPNDTVINQTTVNETGANETINETTEPEPPEPPLLEPSQPTNQTINDTTEEPTELGIPGLPVLDVFIISPDSITRGDYFELRAYARNTGSGPAKDVWIDWILPDSFVILTGSGSIHCQEVAPDTSCWNNITATVSLSSNLGADDVRVRVNYVE